MAQTCIIIPCYNEATRLPVEIFRAYMQIHPDVSFCFVDDGSSDNTQAVLAQLQAAYPVQAEALILSKNQGKAGAVRAGMLHKAAGRYDYLGYFDADLATPLEAIQDLQQTIEQRPLLDMVLGSRIKILGKNIQRDSFRHYVGRVIATCISVVLQLPVYDSQCGAKLFRIRSIPGLFQEPFLSPWLFDVELLARLTRQYGREELLRNRVAEMPLHQWIEQHDSRVKLTYFFKLWYELYRIYQTYKK